jgi:hypothetical protein
MPPHDEALRGNRARSVRRIFYVDPYLGAIPGHWASVARSFIRGVGDVEVRLVGNQRQERAYLEELEVEPLFSPAPYAPYGDDPHDRTRALAAFQAQVDAYASALAGLAQASLTHEDLLFFPTIHPPILGGIVRWIEQAPAHRE